jgi:RNA polymerase sigma-70 factor, ECF subfamily
MLADVHAPNDGVVAGVNGKALELVAALRAKEPWAARALLVEYTSLVERTLYRLLLWSPDIDDLVQEVFLRATLRIGELDDARALPGWLRSIAFYVAREALRARRRRRWLSFVASEDLPEVPVEPADSEAGLALRAVLAVLEGLDEEERLVFTLRVIQEMPMAEVASSCGLSLTTTKRRVSSADAKFQQRAKAHPVLRSWLELEKERPSCE